MTNILMDCVSVRVEGRGQVVRYTEHLRANLRTCGTLRITIHSDSCRAQAWGRIEHWDGSQWQEVASIQGDSLKTDVRLGYKPTAAVPGDFFADRNTLIELAKEVLS